MDGAQPAQPEEFLSGLALDFWRGAATPEATRIEAAFVRRILAADPPAQLLDIACGDGRHALELAAQGYRVTGLDISADRIEEAAAAATGRGLNCSFLQQDMRRFESATAFDGAYCLGNSFARFPGNETLEFLACAARVLKPGARLLLDSGAVAESLLPDYRKRVEMKAGGVEMTAVNHYDAAASLLHIDLEFRRGNSVQTRTTTHHVHTAAELRRMLGPCGLEYVAAYGSAAGGEYCLGSPRLLLVSRRIS